MEGNLDPGGEGVVFGEFALQEKVRDADFVGDAGRVRKSASGFPSGAWKIVSRSAKVAARPVDSNKNCYCTKK